MNCVAICWPLTSLCLCPMWQMFPLAVNTHLIPTFLWPCPFYSESQFYWDFSKGHFNQKHSTTWLYSELFLLNLEGDSEWAQLNRKKLIHICSQQCFLCYCEYQCDSIWKDILLRKKNNITFLKFWRNCPLATTFNKYCVVFYELGDTVVNTGCPPSKPRLFKLLCVCVLE